MTERDTLLAWLDVMALYEAATVTLFGVARQRVGDGQLEIGIDAETVVQAAQCQDEQHYHALVAAGARPAADAFTIGDVLIADPTALLISMLELKAVGIAGYMALNREWARLDEIAQVEISYQMGVVDAQHLALAHALVGVSPANDRAFARWLFAAPEEVLAALAALGLLEGPGETMAFPGPLDRVCRGVFGLTPETTESMTQPRP